MTHVVILLVELVEIRDIAICKVNKQRFGFTTSYIAGLCLTPDPAGSEGWDHALCRHD